MNITVQAEINFHQQTQISIYLKSTASADEEKLAEVAFFAMYAIRMLSNLGVNETSNSLASLLADGHQVVQVLASGGSTGGFDLIPYPGNQGRKRFFATLTLTDSSVKFDLKAKGFGFLATGVGYYGPTSVLALLRYLALQRPKDAVFLRCLGGAAEQCGKAHLAGQITVTNHLQVFSPIFAAYCAPYVAPEVSNEISEWDRITSEADSRLCTNLKAYVLSYLQDYPIDEKMTLLIRDETYALFYGTTNYISGQLDGDLAKYKDSLLSLDASSYLKLLSVFETSHVVTLLLATPAPYMMDYGYCYRCRGICAIYDPPDEYMGEYMSDWHNSLKFLADGENDGNGMAARVSRRTYNEIALLLGLTPDHPLESLFWGEVRLKCLKARKTLLADPEWRGRIHAMLR